MKTWGVRKHYEGIRKAGLMPQMCDIDGKWFSVADIVGIEIIEEDIFTVIARRDNDKYYNLDCYTTLEIAERKKAEYEKELKNKQE